MMKKILITISLIVSMFIIGDVKAASGSVSVKASSQTAIVGKNVTVTVNISSTSTLGSWEAVISYDTAKLRLVSSTATGQRMVGYGDGKKKSTSYTFTFNTIASGKANIYISSARIVDFDSVTDIATSKGSTTVTLKTQAEIESSYSKNNYLSSLSIEGKELTPGFNKDTLEYTVEMEPDTTKVIVNASKEDGTATVTGNGEIAVNDGDNKLEIAVTAQNGNVRKYIINVKVKEHNPIEVTVDGKKYTVVRKKASLTGPANYNETTTKINDEDVPAFNSDITKYTLVGLKDEAGTIALYIYDNNTYKKYQELSFNKIIINLTEPKMIPKNYKKTKIKFNDQEIIAYKLNKNSKYALIYGMNVETGKENLYVYDTIENTVQIYNTEEVDELKKENDLYLKIIIGLTGGVSLLLITFMIILMKKNSKQKHGIDKKKKKRKKDIEKKLEELDNKEVK